MISSRARKMFERSLLIEEKYEANLNLCETYLDQKCPEAALDPGRRAVALSPNSFLAFAASYGPSTFSEI